MDDALLLPGGMAVALVLAGAGLARWRGAGEWPAMAIPLAVLVALTLLLGGIAASPRQLGERLPMLALLLAAPAALATAWPRPVVAWLGWGLAAILGGWWMAGGPAWGDDLAQAWPLAAGLAVAALLPGMALEARWQGAILPVGLTALLWAASPPGPWFQAAFLVGLVGTAALAFGPVSPLAGRVLLAPLLVALAAGPVIAQGRWSDWLVAGWLAAMAALGWGWQEWRGRLGQALLCAAGLGTLLLLR